MDDKKNAEKTPKFFCKICNYKCSKLSDWNRHITTAKHKRMTMDDNIHADYAKNEKTSLHRLQSNGRGVEITYSAVNVKGNDKWICECGKSYKFRQGLHKHKKTCNKIPDINKEEDETINPVNSEVNYMEIIQQMQQNQLERDRIHSEQIQQLMSRAGNNNNSNNTTNNTFNLNFFLNNDCKDAMNMTDFIESLQVQLKDLEYTTDNGHIKGITNIFSRALANMEETKRPMHCTDLKREVLYIKDNNEWHKDEDKGILKGAVTKVVDKNLSNSEKWLDEHPDVLTPGSKDSNRYIKMTENSLGTGEESEQHKIMKNIMKEVKIERK